MMYRDKITIADNTYRANVWVLSTSTKVADSSLLNTTIVTVAVPVKYGEALSTVSRFTWRGREYVVRGEAVPIIALGRLDHWEMTGTRSTAV